MYRLNPSQKAGLELLSQKSITVFTGDAGCGKTHAALTYAVKMAQQRKIDKLVVIRSPLESGRTRMGFLPGTYDEKLAVWMKPVFAILKELRVAIPVECHSPGFLTGMTFDKAFIIADDCQNFTIDEFRIIVSRMGRESQLCFCGDQQQDSRHSKGLPAFIRATRHLDCVGVQEFDSEHNMRHPDIREVLKALEGNWDDDNYNPIGFHAGE